MPVYNMSSRLNSPASYLLRVSGCRCITGSGKSHQAARLMSPHSARLQPQGSRTLMHQQPEQQQQQQYLLLSTEAIVKQMKVRLGLLLLHSCWLLCQDALQGCSCVSCSYPAGAHAKCTPARPLTHI
jgi:hypothetical protein